MRTLLPPFVALLAVIAPAWAQDIQPGPNFTSVPGKVPQATSHSESAHFADIDSDGDLDALMTQGGTFVSAQTRLWTSDASSVGVPFVFTDATSTNLPLLLAESEHITSFDIDNDGDLDLLLSNTTQFFTQSNVWLINQGGAQGGAPGVFLIDQTRWTGLGAAGSSIPSSLLITSGVFGGGFADWSNQCSFADVDLDGDYDYLQTSLGPTSSGATMSRLFLNNGSGFFAEYNPSGAVSGSTALASGSSAGWCEGTQTSNTTDAAGMKHDITNTTFSSSYADIDNDFDLDLVVQSRTTQSRIYQNRFIENALSLGNETAGTRLYRDVTGNALATLQNGGQCMDLEFADFDADDDADLWAVSYSSLQERILSNNGSGIFTSIGSPSGDPGSDENEVAVLDYDGDGDLDVAAANFEGSNYLYKNLAAQGANTSSASTLFARTSVFGVETELATPGTVADSWLSVDTGDLDNDKDIDIIFSEDGTNTSAALHINSLGVPDVVAPRIPRVKLLGPTTGPSATPRVVAAQAYDNDSFDRLGEANAKLTFIVNGGVPQIRAAQWSGGNIFRSTIPGYWVGTIQYWMDVTDRAGNTASSAIQSINIPGAGISSYGVSVPGCSGPQIMSVNSAPTLENSEFEIQTTNCPPNASNLLLISDIADVQGTAPPLGIILFVDLNSPSLTALTMSSDSNGLGVAPIPLNQFDPSIVGNTYYAQVVSLWNGPCPAPPVGLSSSNAISITVLP